jgi:hypothetical protein
MNDWLDTRGLRASVLALAMAALLAGGALAG